MIAVPATAQVQNSTPAPAAVPAPAVFASATPAGLATLRTGTPVALRLMEQLTTKGKKLRVGQRFRMETVEPLVVEGQVVVPAGSPAIGEISEVKNKGMWGKSGHLGARILYLTANGRQIRLTGAFDDKGTAGGVGAVAVSALVFLPAGFFMTGTSATVPQGAQVKGFVDEDVPLAFASNAGAPMAIAAAPAPVAAPPAPATTVAAVAVPAAISTPAIDPAKRADQKGEYDRLLRQGFSPAAARTAAERKFGFPMN